MSQTETLLLFVLGFCAALFVVLLFGRGIWAIMGSWAGFKETRMVPAAIRELQAERDGLKAEKAMLAQKLEASINDMKMRMAEQMAEVSRNRNRILDVTQTLKERESTIEHLQNQLADRSAQVTSLQSQIEENVKSINLAYAKVAQRDDDHSKIQSALKETQGVLLQRDEKIRNLVDETQALREIAVNTVPAARVSANAPLASESVTQISGGFETRFANGNVNNPLLAASGDDFVSTLKEEVVPASLEVQAIAKSDEQVERSASNVLSLADRVRNLQSGMKKS